MRSAIRVIMQPVSSRVHILFGQCILAIDVEVAGRNGRSGVGLATADADRVIPLRDDRIAILRHHAQIARLQIEVNFLACAGIEMNALKSTQSYDAALP